MQKERRDQFAQSPVAARMVPTASGRICCVNEFSVVWECCGHVALLRDDPSYARHRGDVKIDMDGADNQMQLLEQQVCCVLHGFPNMKHGVTFSNVSLISNIMHVPQKLCFGVTLWH